MVTYHETRKPVGHGHGHVPDSFLDVLVAWAKAESDSVFAENSNYDVYSLTKPVLGPYTSLLHRKAVMCEWLRLNGGFESDWNWLEGRDTTAGDQTPDEMEAGAFQVSYNSVHLGADLGPFLMQRGITDAESFQRELKANPALQCAYTARLWRANYRHWSGPTNREWPQSNASRAAVNEFQSLFALP